MLIASELSHTIESRFWADRVLNGLTPQISRLESTERAVVYGQAEAPSTDMFLETMDEDARRRLETRGSWYCDSCVTPPRGQPLVPSVTPTSHFNIGLTLEPLVPVTDLDRRTILAEMSLSGAPGRIERTVSLGWLSIIKPGPHPLL